MSDEIKVDEAQSAESSTVEIKLEDALKNPDFAKQLKSYVDSASGKAVEAYKDKGFAAAVDKAVESRIKARETKTPEQIKFDEYESKLAEMQSKIAEKELSEMRGKNKDLARGKFKEAKLPDSLLDFFVSEDEEKTNKNLEKAMKALGDFRDEVKKGVLSGNNTVVPGKTVTTSGLKEPGPGATKQQWADYWKQAK